MELSNKPDSEKATVPFGTPPLVVIHSHPVWLPQTQTWMYNQVHHLPGELVESHIVCEQTLNLDQFEVPNIHCLRDESMFRYVWQKGLRELRLRRHSEFLVRVARTTSAGVLHSHFGNVGWADLGVAGRLGLKHIVTFYGFDVSRLPSSDPRWRDRYRQLFAQADHFLCEGPHMADQLVGLGCAEENIRVHHLGVAIDSIPYRPRHWTPGEPLRVLIAGTFREKKGIPYALEALGAISRDVELEITVIGGAKAETRDEIEGRRIIKTIQECKLESVTRLLGFQPHQILMEEAYRHHIFISPSVTASDGDTEGGAPVTIIEMMASGMPIVSTMHCDIPEVVQYGKIGWLAPERDAVALSRRLEWLIEQHEDWAPMIEAGRRRAESEFNVGLQGKLLADIYREPMS